jgi:hypothetical protein
LANRWSPTLAERLQPLLQRVQDGAEEAADRKVFLDADATSAEEEIDGLLMAGSGYRSLIDYSDSAQIVDQTDTSRAAFYISNDRQSAALLTAEKDAALTDDEMISIALREHHAQGGTEDDGEIMVGQWRGPADRTGFPVL